MTRKKPGRPSIWAYAYALVPPQTEDRLGGVRQVLEHGNAEARRGARTWVGSVVLEREITRILVVSDSPNQNLEINRALEAELRELRAGFTVTSSMRVTDDPMSRQELQ